MTWNQITPAPYTLKAKAVKTSSSVDSPQITVTVHSFPQAAQPTLTPAVTEEIGTRIHHHYSFPITIQATASVADGSIVQMDLYQVNIGGDPVRLARQTGSPVSSSFTWPQARSSLLGEAWAVALDSKGCESDQRIPASAQNSTIARFRIYGGALDTSFAPPSPSVINGVVNAVAAQSDGEVVIGGDFTMVYGTPRNRIARLNNDGTLDTGFNPNANGSVKAIAIQSDDNEIPDDNKILVGGAFTMIGGATRNRVARLNSNGTLDESFDANANADDTVNAVVQSGDKILIGGNFTTVGGVTRKRVARFSANGQVDNFNPDISNGAVNAIAKSGDMISGEMILVGGTFTTIGGTTRNRIARFDANTGTLDPNFDPNADGEVMALAVDAVGANYRVLLGGVFTAVAGGTRNGIARLTSDGALDTDFQTGVGGLDASVTCIALQTDGKVLIGGGFTTVNGDSRNRVVRLLPSGSLDNDFRQAPGSNLSAYGPNDVVRAIAIDTQGMIEIGGNFTTYSYDLNPMTIDATRQRVARIGGL